MKLAFEQVLNRVFSFLGSLAPVYFVFNNINLNQNFASFSVPSVPNIPNQGQEIKPYSP